jgi:hypothetical protein
MKHFDDCTKAQKLKRWENVLRVLRALTPHQRRKHWDMSTWGVKTECGTVACAAGHCGLDPWFRKQGFRLIFPKGYEYGDFNRGVYATFGLDGADRIFYDDTPRSVGDVIREVRDYIKELRSGG